MCSIGHWINKTGVDDCNVTLYNSFVYVVIFPNQDMYIGYKSIFSQKSGKETNWKHYKTSSKVVKGRGDLELASFTMLGVYKDYNLAMEIERELLININALRNIKCLNQCISHKGMLRRPESYTEEAIHNAKMGLLKHIDSDEYVHPMQDKVHPNRGKKLPQTAPKRHVSVDNFQITDGVINKWHPKDKDLPEGYRKGWTTKKRIVGENQKQRLREMHAENVQRIIDSYYINPKHCENCGVELEYALRNRKGCSDECSKILHKIGVRGRDLNWAEESTKKGVDTRNKRYAKDRGFDSYFKLAEYVYTYLKTHSYSDCQDELDMARSTVYNLKKYYEIKLKENELC